MKKTQTTYIEADDDGTPLISPRQLLQDLTVGLGLGHLHLCHGALTNCPGKNRRKVRITITVETVK